MGGGGGGGGLTVPLPKARSPSPLSKYTVQGWIKGLKRTAPLPPPPTSAFRIAGLTCKPLSCVRPCRMIHVNQIRPKHKHKFDTNRKCCIRSYNPRKRVSFSGYKSVCNTFCLCSCLQYFQLKTKAVAFRFNFRIITNEQLFAACTS